MSTAQRKEKKGNTEKTKFLAMIGVMTAVLCIVSPFVLPIPFSPVPVSLATLAIYIAVYVLGMKNGTISCLVYLLIGLVGVPVFSGFSSGPAKLLGPTGGYLIGYVFMAVIAGYFIDHWYHNKFLCFLGLVLGTFVCYAFGTGWLAHQGEMTLTTAIASAVIPFIPGDLVKIIFAMVIGPQISKPLKRAGLN